MADHKVIYITKYCSFTCSVDFEDVDNLCDQIDAEIDNYTDFNNLRNK